MQSTSKAPTTGLIRHATVNESADAAGNTSTGYTVSVGDTFNGSISSGADQDWVAVNLIAGQSYVFWVRGVGGSSTGLNDTTLAVHNSSGSQIVFNDDVLPGANIFSAIQFTASATGTYYINVGSYSSGTGNYALEVSTNTFSIGEISTYLTEFDWGAPTAIHLASSAGGTITYNINGLTPAGQQLAQWALEAWGIALGITFVPSNSSSAQIMFDDNQSGAFAGPSSYNPNTGVITQSSVNVSTSWLSTYGTTIDSYSYLTYLHEIGHALGLGHAGPYDGSATYGSDNLYLNDSYQVSIMSYFSVTDNPNVSGSNFRPVTPMVADLAAVHALYGTPTAYSGNTTWGENSNVGGLLGTIFGIFFDGNPGISSTYNGGPIGFTIYDTGGTDTLDLGSQTANQLIDLRQEGVSNVGGLTGNMVIAGGTVIENAIGGSGADQIIGNSAANRLTGGLGNDWIDGGGGNDTAVLAVARSSVTATDIGGGQIRIVSALGTDTYINIENFEFSDGTVSAATLLGGGSGPMTGTPGPDSLIGDASANTIFGLAGNDSIWGHGGNDVVDAGDGRDRVFLGAGNDQFTDSAQTGFGGSDLVYLGVGNDTVTGGGGNDTIHAMDGADSVVGGTGNETIYAGAGNDTVSGGDGNDAIWGGPGNDTHQPAESGDDLIFAFTGNDLITGGPGNDTLWAGPGDDTVTGGTGGDRGYLGPGNDVYHDEASDNASSPRDVIFLGEGNDTAYGTGGQDVFHGLGGDDLIQGGGGDDEIFGGTNADNLQGGAGNDLIFGGKGTDLIDMGAGDDTFRDTWQSGALGMDTITGGAGADTFWFTANSSHDVITDFEVGIDTLRLPQRIWPGTLTAAEVVDQFATVTLAGVVFDFGNGMSITLQGVTSTAGLAGDIDLF